tara:strand:- start:7011 stop:7976 length:966 start_codon:yes stop_codon:yes gene_type:complete
MKKILVTGHAGFIGYHLANKLIDIGYNVTGIDSLNDYYDVNLKKARLKNLEAKNSKNYKSIIHDLSDNSTNELLNRIKPDYILNLAAQAGVRHSLTNPEDYVKNNITAYLNILEYAKNSNIERIIYASTSSVYGGNEKFPFSEDDFVNTPLQFYAVTKNTNEQMSEAYKNLYGLKFTGLRFFTVYGPWGRPDMALFLFTKNIIADLPIKVFNNGNHFRNFTYVDDIVDGIIGCLESNYINFTDHEIFNLAGTEKVKLIDFIAEIEKNLGKKAKLNLMPLQKGDVIGTEADLQKINRLFNYSPKIDLKTGVKEFINWYKGYY